MRAPAVILLGLSIAVCASLGKEVAPHLPLGPMLGHVSHDDARLWVKASGACDLSVRVSEQEDLSEAREVKGPRLETITDFTGVAIIAGLKPATRYFYAIQLDQRPVQHAPYNSFQTAPLPGRKGHLRFVFGSCVGHFGFESAATWGDMASRTNFDLLLMLGDNHYADTTDPHKQRSAYYSHRKPAGFQEISRQIPVYGIWDDHDFADNDSDGTAKGKEHSLETFRQFWANPAYGQPDDPGVYFKFTRGDVDFFMLDDRYHRSPNKARNDGRKTMLGAAQLAWLKRELAASKATVKFIANGSEWQTHSHVDSFASFAREREEIFQFIQTNHMEGVILLSGDRHYTACYQIHSRFLEVSSSPLGSIDTRTGPVPEMFFYHDQGKMYCLFDVNTSGSTPEITLEIYGVGEGLLLRRPFTWDEVNGRARMPFLKKSSESQESLEKAPERSTATKGN